MENGIIFVKTHQLLLIQEQGINSACSLSNTNKMKLAGLTLILFLSGITFGQSAKKVNTRLLTELTREQQKQDSAYQVFFQLRSRQENLKKQFGEEKERFITESSNTLFYRDSISRSAYNLKRLGQAPDLKDVTTYMDMSNGWYFLQSVLSMKKELEPFDTLSEFSVLNELKLKQQNELLEAKLTEFHELEKLNNLRMQRNESGIRQLESAISLLDSATRVYENATGILLPKKRSLDAQLNDLRENYRLKGPKGFPDAYQTVFPDVHPTKSTEEYAVLSALKEAYSACDIVAPPAEAPRSKEQEPEIYTLVEEPAEFPGGMSALKKYLTDKLQYPEKAKEMGISGKVFIQFVVSKEGEVNNVKLKRGLSGCPECDTEAIRLIKSMPKWKPAKNNGKIVASYFNLPVTFKL